MRRAIVTRSRFGASAVALIALAGCGATSSNPPPRTLAASTSHGLTYSLRVTTTNSEQCVAASYRTASAPGGPVSQGSRLCGATELPGHPVLVQAHGSPESLLTDVSRSCGTIQGGPSHASLHPLVHRCTATGTPTFRVTTIPAVAHIVIVGIPGVPVLNFPRHRCRTGICITPLA